MISYHTGDATDVTSGIIAHVCNDLGHWGAGFVLAVSARWPGARDAYTDWALHGQHFSLGQIQLVRVSEKLQVANMIAQRGHRGPGNPVPLRYPALSDCLDELDFQISDGGTAQIIHMPRIGCGLAGGNWDRVESLIAACIGDYDVRVYDL